MNKEKKIKEQDNYDLNLDLVLDLVLDLDLDLDFFVILLYLYPAYCNDLFVFEV